MDVSIISDMQFTLQCQSKADPTADVTWRPPRDQPIIRQDPGDQRVNGYSVVGSDLIIQNADMKKHFGQWICTACNRHGCASATRQVIVQGMCLLRNGLKS